VIWRWCSGKYTGTFAKGELKDMGTGDIAWRDVRRQIDRQNCQFDNEETFVCSGEAYVFKFDS